ncbi:MAG: hypothetical protein ACXU89_06470, partial [Xanthobacteraceae bacterium]
MAAEHGAPRAAASAASAAQAGAFFAPHRKPQPATIALLSRIARTDISSPREQGVRLVFGRGCNVFA